MALASHTNAQVIHGSKNLIPKWDSCSITVVSLPLIVSNQANGEVVVIILTRPSYQGDKVKVVLRARMGDHLTFKTRFPNIY